MDLLRKHSLPCSTRLFRLRWKFLNICGWTVYSQWVIWRQAQRCSETGFSFRSWHRSPPWGSSGLARVTGGGMHASAHHLCCRTLTSARAHLLSVSALYCPRWRPCTRAASCPFRPFKPQLATCLWRDISGALVNPTLKPTACHCKIPSSGTGITHLPSSHLQLVCVHSVL